MKTLVKEYRLWLKDHQHLILHLKKHDSIIYTRVQPVYEVLNFLSSEYEGNGMDFGEDIFKIFQIGLEYLHTQVDTCKLYLEKYFQQDLHQFLHYEHVISYLLYLEDLRYELEEHQMKSDDQIINHLVDELEGLMEKKEPEPENLNLYVDSQVHRIVDTTKFTFKSIIDIFVEISDALGINLYSENEYMIGKDI